MVKKKRTVKIPKELKVARTERPVAPAKRVRECDSGNPRLKANRKAIL